MEIKTAILNELIFEIDKKDEAYGFHDVSLPANFPVLNPLPLPLPRLPALYDTPAIP